MKKEKRFLLEVTRSGRVLRTIAAAKLKPVLILVLLLSLASGVNLFGQPAGVPNQRQAQPDDVLVGPGDGPPPDFGPPGADGPGFGPPGFGGPGGPGMREEIKLVKQFDKNSDGWLNTAERNAARKFLEEQRANGEFRGRRGPGGRFGGRFGGEESPPAPGIKISPDQVKSYPDAPLYASNVLRTLFLQFESADWEKELETFHGTDVELPATLQVDARRYSDVGIRFRGNTSYMMVGTGSKRPLNISVDMAHPDQNVLGFRTLNLLNAHEDPSFLRAVLALQMARDYFPAPRANFVRLVINGENWGVYANVEQFNKDFLRDNFGTGKGARWKVPGSPGGRGGLEYLGEDVAQYQRIYEIKSKDEPRAWASLINLCKILNQTPAAELQTRLGSVLDIDQALRFLAWDNVLAGGDGFWTRASDYCLYEDSRGRFHLVPYDVNETFSTGGGPGGPRGRGGFGPGMFLAREFVDMGDANNDAKLSADEFKQLSDVWFTKLDADRSGKVGREQFLQRLNELLPPPGGDTPGAGRPPAGPGRGRLFGPGAMLGPAIFSAADSNNDETVTRDELDGLFAKWFKEWNTTKADGLTLDAVRDGLNSSLPRPQLAGPGGPGQAQGQGQGRAFGFRRGPGGFGGPGARGGTTLDPLIATNDTSKPLLSKLLAVPELRTRYLGYVRHMAETWLDWKKLGPIARQYHGLIADELKADTKKLSSFEQFQAALEGAPSASGTAEGQRQSSNSGNQNQNQQDRSLKGFAEQRRNYLLNHAAVKAVKPLGPKQTATD